MIRRHLSRLGLAARRLTTLVALTGLVAGCTTRAETPKVLRFTAIPNENTTELLEKFQPVAHYLEASLGVPVEYVPSRDYGASVEAFRSGRVQLAWFGGLTGVRARLAVPGARAIAQGRVDPEYRSYFVAHCDTGLERSQAFPEGLRGLTFTFGSRGSTSGRLMPEHFIRRFAGETPAQFFGREMQFSGSHDKTAKLVEAGTFQAGALDYKTYDRLVAEGRLDPEKCRVIWVTPPFPDYQWTAHPGLEELFPSGATDESFIERLRRALVDMREPELLRAVNRPEGLIPAANEDFAVIRELALELDLVRG